MAAAPSQEATGTERRRTRVRSGDVALALLVGGAAFLLINFSLTEIVALLYNPIAGLIAFLLVLEFLWLKSSDRTRVYKIEIDRLRAMRRKDEDLLRRAREVIHQGVVYPETEAQGRPGDWRQRAIDAVRDIDERL